MDRPDLPLEDPELVNVGGRGVTPRVEHDADDEPSPFSLLDPEAAHDDPC